VHAPAPVPRRRAREGPPNAAALRLSRRSGSGISTGPRWGMIGQWYFGPSDRRSSTSPCALTAAGTTATSTSRASPSDHTLLMRLVSDVQGCLLRPLRGRRTAEVGALARLGDAPRVRLCAGLTTAAARRTPSARRSRRGPALRGNFPPRPLGGAGADLERVQTGRLRRGDPLIDDRSGSVPRDDRNPRP
jgi:hypothetical protein